MRVLNDVAEVQFVGGGFGASVCPQHVQTAYCDFIAYNVPAVLAALKDYFAHIPEAHVLLSSFSTAQLPPFCFSKTHKVSPLHFGRRPLPAFTR